MHKSIRSTEQSGILPTHDIDVSLPMNTKYISTNPISVFLIRRFMIGLVDLVIGVNPRRVLDVGCGEGLVSRQLAAACPNAVIYGVDIAPELLEVAGELKSDMFCIVGSTYQLPLPANSYDLVICTEVLEHLEDPEWALREIARVTTGYCLFSVPNEPWWRLANMVRGSYISDWGNTPGHVNHWRAKQFVRLVCDYFKVEALRRPFPWTMVLGSV